MNRTMRVLLGTLLLGAIGLIVGCGGEGKPNPTLKVPDVPPGNKAKGPALKKPGQR